MSDEEAKRPDDEALADGDLTPLAAIAVALHEMFTAFVFAGFTEQQALYLVADNMSAGITHIQENLEDDEEDTI